MAHYCVRYCLHHSHYLWVKTTIPSFTLTPSWLALHVWRVCAKASVSVYTLREKRLYLNRGLWLHHDGTVIKKTNKPNSKGDKPMAISIITLKPLIDL